MTFLPTILMLAKQIPTFLIGKRTILYYTIGITVKNVTEKEEILRDKMVEWRVSKINFKQITKTVIFKKPIVQIKMKPSKKIDQILSNWSIYMSGFLLFNKVNLSLYFNQQVIGNDYLILIYLGI